jgi:alkylation response protein AidB-like acyl-CoA dehydrogenase
MDICFIIERNVLQAPAEWLTTPAHAELDMATAKLVLVEAGRFAVDVLAPLNATADLEGCTLKSGKVRTPDGFPRAYRQFVEGGWPSLTCSPAWGGQGLPILLDAGLREMVSACNHAWGMYPDLLHGAYETLRSHASEELKERYLSHIASGRWLAAMALTEPQAGSDLGLIRTLAETQPDGSVLVSGDKIFISGGDHDLSDNIVHLVLCRLPDSTTGTKGLSLVLVPKILPDGSRNALVCTGIEKKMGLRGSATCAMRYERAKGWLVGAPGKGLAAMFVMMNSARLHVSLQGLGHQEMATQNAVRYSLDRAQGRVAREPATVAIARHPAVRRALWRLQALTEGQRVMAYRVAHWLDAAANHADPAQRARAGGLAGLLTPVIKAFLTHQGFQGASAALQVFGGYGYVHEFGIEQSVRDARITMIYEGTNEIQAIDLLQRKVLGDGGVVLAQLLDDMRAESANCMAIPALNDFAVALADHVQQVGRATAALRATAIADPEWPLRVADDYLMGVAYALLAWSFAASARAAVDLPDRGWAEAKTARMRFGLQWILPDAMPFWHRVTSQAIALDEVGDSA